MEIPRASYLWSFLDFDPEATYEDYVFCVKGNNIIFKPALCDLLALWVQIFDLVLNQAALFVRHEL